MKKKLQSLLLFFFTINCFGQFSKTHYIPPLTGQNAVLVQDQYLYISTPSLANVNFKIIPIGGNPIYGTVNQNVPFVYTVNGTGYNTQLFTPPTNTGIITDKGFIIEAEDLVYVSVRVNAGNNNHAGGLVSKGNSALGTIFRLGAMLNPTLNDQALSNFASILATENGTNITISNLPNGTRLVDGTTVSGTISIILNKNESYIMALQNYNDANLVSNSSKMIGALVQSDKPVVVNSGSFGGSNSNVVNNNGAATGRDLGFDQIVSLEKTGKEYIFVKGIGTDELERVLLVAHSDNTQIFLNGDTSNPYKTLNSGEYIAIDGSNFINDNMYITTSQNVFAYQSIGGLAPGFLPNGNPSNPPANQNLFFVPPINCSTPNTVDNIPQIQSIGNNPFSGVLNIVTETGATVLLNNTPIVASPIPITGTSAFVRYTVSNLSGNIAVKSSKQVYVSYFGTNGAATYGGYYSGFDLKPEIVSEIKLGANTYCIGNVNLKINTLSSYDSFQWFKNDVAIPSATNSTYTPDTPGYYQVIGSISGCVSDVQSDKIPVSDCPLDSDNDGTNNNIDVDLDNDGILNTVETNFPSINQSNPLVGTGYTATATGDGTIIGKPNFGFISQLPVGKNKQNTYTIDFNASKYLKFSYITQDLPNPLPTGDYMNGEGDFILKVPNNETLTILDPDGQLVIDTNYDGIYESGITEFSSFEIRFRLKNAAALSLYTGTFSINTNSSNQLTFIHRNLSETNSNQTAFQINSREQVDSDLDIVPDFLDLDSDNDGIPDTIEAQGKGFKAYSGIDTNKDGLDDAFGSGLQKTNTDNDVNGTANFVTDVFDIDSDNDGIYDLIESGSNAPDTNIDGIIDGLPADFGANGLFDALETSPDSGKLKYTLADTEGNGDFNYIDLDSDNDGCNDVIEAGFTDPNFDGLIGDIPVTVNTKGKVTSTTNGYTLPNPNYIIATPIIITKQPENQNICELQNGTFSLESNADSFQWQHSVDGINWNNIATNNSNYTNATTNALTVKNVTYAMNGYQYRVLLKRINNDCGPIPSNAAKLSLLALPVVNSPITIVQCDDDTDGISRFNVTEKNSFVSANSANETFTYYTTLMGANTKDTSTLISYPLAYTSSNKNIWARVENLNGCFSVAQLNLIVSTTQINPSFNRSFIVCDDFLDATNDDKDGITAFNFSSVTTDIQALLPPPSTNYTIKYYENEADALAETNAIANPADYRNTTPNQQKVWVRVESNLDNACFGLGPYITLQVNPKPNIDLNSNLLANRFVCTNLPTFFVKLDAGIIGNTPASAYNYVWSKDGIVIPGETYDTLEVNEEGKYTVEVSTLIDNNCSRTRTIIVTASDIANLDSVSISDLSETNTVDANVSGTGNYEYSLNLPNGPFQESDLFENVPPGIHTLFIRDKNGCGTVSKTIAVLGIPKFFTPNNDGYNDYWNVKGVNETFNSSANIFIYDRYGKVVKQIIPSSNNGWDGTYIGKPMPSDDYWFTIKLEDGREAKGHFSLRR